MGYRVNVGDNAFVCTVDGRIRLGRVEALPDTVGNDTSCLVLDTGEPFPVLIDYKHIVSIQKSEAR